MSAVPMLFCLPALLLAWIHPFAMQRSRELEGPRSNRGRWQPPAVKE